MKPSEVIYSLNLISSGINNSRNPDRRIVAQDLEILLTRISAEENEGEIIKEVTDELKSSSGLDGIVDKIINDPDLLKSLEKNLDEIGLDLESMSSDPKANAKKIIPHISSIVCRSRIKYAAEKDFTAEAMAGFLGLFAGPIADLMSGKEIPEAILQLKDGIMHIPAHNQPNFPFFVTAIGGAIAGFLIARIIKKLAQKKK
jgi:hypothetical protein